MASITDDIEAPDCEHCPGRCLEHCMHRAMVLSLSTAIDSGHIVEQCSDCREAIRVHSFACAYLWSFEEDRCTATPCDCGAEWTRYPMHAI